MKQTFMLIVTLTVWMAAAEADTDSWPRKVSANNLEFTIYQPQIESWQGTELKERAAVAVQATTAAEPTFGVLWLSARTDVDKTRREVSLVDIKINRVHFPSEEGQDEQFRSLLERNTGTALGAISLDRLRASLAITANETKRQSLDLKNDPPEIYYSDRPAVLVQVDGDPVLRPSSEEGWTRVINTRALLLVNSTNGQFHLFAGGAWFQAPQLAGPWKVEKPSGNLAATLAKIKANLETNQQVDNLEENSANHPPAIFVSTKPAELIQTQGALKFEPIPQTELLYVTNTPDDLFLNTSDQGYYVTFSGRWFRSNSIKGTWRFVPSDKLPPEFAKIPESHPKGEILAMVAGTPQAQEAAIASEIPQTATVDRTAASLTVSYDGPPQFKAIENSRLQYGVNTTVPVIREANGTYYAVENGVWFSSLSAQGPWVVVADVPRDIYSIPPSCPIYNVTFVYIYGADPRFVYVGYLPGYLGSYVNSSGVVVYGTGYNYQPWVQRAWVGHPVTYGYGLAWGYGFGWTFRPAFFGAAVYHPWWGPWPHYWAHFNRPMAREGMTINHMNIYRNWKENVVRPSAVHVYTPARFSPLPHSTTPTVHNNIYADRTGNVYRNSQSGWEHYSARQWLPAQPSHQERPLHSEKPSHPVESAPMATAAHLALTPPEVEREHVARQRGEASVRRYSPAPGAPTGHRSPHPH